MLDNESGEQSRILVVEDFKFFSNLVRKAVVERIGADVTVAKSFAEARAAVEQNDRPFDLALVDVVLPDAPNGEAISWIREYDIPCVVFTSVLSEPMRERFLAQNVIDYVVKDTPTSLDYLLGLVERLHRNRNVKVLIVDDSRATRQFLKGLLTTYRFQVIEAGTGREGLAALAAHPDTRLIVTDYFMPDMNGVEMVKQIRASHPQDRLSIIGISSGGSALSAQFIKYGASDFIHKPFLREEFFCRVNHNLNMLDMVDRLVHMATRDVLTGLHNRRYFFEAGEKLFASARRQHLRLGVAMIDIDFFKKVNDTHGHQGGDAVLKRVAKLIGGMCRETDIVARFGGEEFAILAVNVDPEKLHAFLDRIRAAIESAEIVHADRRIPVTASFGAYQGDADSLEAMLKFADERLYQAKQGGRNRVEVVA
ncbi:MAG: diguanylate cyclase [Proteobacteria bacterium]|nr:diguanylate cyclase [Pseudomonadota bacterium]